MTVTLAIAAEGPRRCGDCSLCCKLLPVKTLRKPAGQRCQHQRYGKGCAIHAQLSLISPSCALWSCRWLVGDDTAELRRPDRSHYVIDLLPDFVSIVDDATGSRRPVQVIQVWVDPKYPDAHRDPSLRSYLDRRASEGIAAIVRRDNRSAFVLFAPAMSADGQWDEVETNFSEAEHSFEEVIRTLEAT